MGAWMFVEPNLEWVLIKIDAASKRPRYAGGQPRPHGHRIDEQAYVGAEDLLEEALGVQSRLGRTDMMMTEIKVPALGESVTEATIGQWFKKAGEAVKADEPVVELETDKVTVEVPAPAAGVLRRSRCNRARR